MLRCQALFGVPARYRGNRQPVRPPARRCSLIYAYCSLVVLDPRVGHTMDVLSPSISVPAVILIDSSTESPVRVLMLSIQAVRGLPRLH